MSLRILIADDEALLRRDLKEALEDLGYRKGGAHRAQSLPQASRNQHEEKPTHQGRCGCNNHDVRLVE